MTNRRLRGRFLGQIVVALLIGITPLIARAQPVSPCWDTTSVKAQRYKQGYAVKVSNTDSASVRERTNLMLPFLSAAQVKLVGDTVVCRAASVAYDAAVNIDPVDKPVIVLDLGPTRRIVVKDIGFVHYWSNVLFDRDFTIAVGKIGY